jgi:hypothetical protein
VELHGGSGGGLQIVMHYIILLFFGMGGGIFLGTLQWRRRQQCGYDQKLVKLQVRFQFVLFCYFVMFVLGF